MAQEILPLYFHLDDYHHRYANPFSHLFSSFIFEGDENSSSTVCTIDRDYYFCFFSFALSKTLKLIIHKKIKPGAHLPLCVWVFWPAFVFFSVRVWVMPTRVYKGQDPRNTQYYDCSTHRYPISPSHASARHNKFVFLSFFSIPSPFPFSISSRNKLSGKRIEISVKNRVCNQ